MKRGIKHKSFFVLQVTFSLKYAEILFVGMVFIVSIISPHVIIESTIILSVHLLFLQTQVLNNFFCTHVFFKLTPIFIIIPFYIWITFYTIKFTFIFTWYMFVRVFISFITVIMLALFRMSAFGTVQGWGGAWQKGSPSLKSVKHILQWWNLAQLYLT